MSGLSGDADRPELSPADRGRHRPADRQHRLERRGRRSRGDRIWVAGYVVRDPPRGRRTGAPPGPSTTNWSGQGIVGIAGVTPGRSSATCAPRDRCGPVFSGVGARRRQAELLNGSRNQPPMLGADLCGDVSTTELRRRTRRPQRFTVAATDLGIKTNTRATSRCVVSTHVLPSRRPSMRSAISGRRGVPVQRARRSGHRRPRGRGDPAGARRRIPLFGICFGNQILGGRWAGRPTRWSSAIAASTSR